MIKKVSSILLLAIVLTVFIPSTAGAVGLSSLIGGKILLVEPCCNGIKITVGPPNAGIFLFMPGVSRLYANFNIMIPGTWVLGNAFGVATCQRVVSIIPCAIPEPVPGGIIRMIGTSGVGGALGL